MMTYEWDYDVPSSRMVRVKSRIEQISKFSDEGMYKILIMTVPKDKRRNSNIEFDGKVIFNTKEDPDYSSYLDVLFHYVQRDGQEEHFIENLPDGLRKQYLAVVLGGYYGTSDWADYYDVYDYATGEKISGVEVK